MQGLGGGVHREKSKDSYNSMKNKINNFKKNGASLKTMAFTCFSVSAVDIYVFLILLSTFLRFKNLKIYS